MGYKHLFGPVASRRLGISLGVDVMPAKTCNLNCIYCECGATTVLSQLRKEWVSSAEIVAELSDFLNKSPKLDYVTITGSGEPTLNTGLGTIVRFLKKGFPQYATALLTNGTLFTLKEVRNAACEFDVVLPSLDAITNDVFFKLNRPHRDLDNNKIIQGLKQFGKEYKGAIWLELFIVPGLNDTEKELALLKETLIALSPGRVQLNTLDRPGACNGVAPASGKRLAEIARFLRPLAVEIISRKYAPPSATKEETEFESVIVATLRRRPSTVEDLAVAAGSSINDIAAVLSRLEKANVVASEIVRKRIFFKVLA
jgi:wyosine [tRNA(Phe)-imidazoG37] synthetase (radical SAM superfamily)